MSNSCSTFLYGCEADSYVSSPERSARISELSELGVETDHVYSGHGDFYFWGRTFGGVDNGFGEVPEGPSEDVRAEVDAAWEALPERAREILGPPKYLIIVYTD